MGVYRLLRKAGLPIVPAAIAGSLLLLFYGMMAGFSVSACRAIGMYLLRMGAELFGRSYDMLTALGILAAGMVLKNPYYLQNAGFLLSFSSVLGIGGIYPALTGGKKKPVRPRYYGEKKWRLWMRKAGRSLQDAWLASFSIVLATLPVQLWNYYEVPVYSVFLNLLVLPLMKLLLGAGILSLLPGLGFAGAADRAILWYYERLCTLFDSLPFHTWNPGRPRVWQVVLYYGVLVLVVIWEESRKRTKESLSGKESKRCGKGRQWAGGMKYAALGAAILILAVHPKPSNKVIFLDVGQGDCCLMQTASGENYLFDCGSSSRSGVGRYVLLPCLKYYGISTLDAVFVSHPDTDHINGILEMLELAEDNHIQVGQLVLPAIESVARDGQFAELLDASEGLLKSGGAAYLAAGENWQCGAAQFTCLHPKKGYSAENANAYSLCIYAEFESFSLLLTGDVEGEGETALTKALEEKGISGVTVLKVAHHGSRGATGDELLARVNPGLAVISCGRNNRYGHPHAELLERLDRTGCAVFLTAENGAITVQSVKNGIKVWGYGE